MASTASASVAVGPLRNTMLARFIAAIEAFHAVEQALEGDDPGTGQPYTPEARTAAIDAATMRLTLEMHAAIDTAWSQASATAVQTLWGTAEAPVQAARVLESEIARQKAFASRFAMDIARGETDEGRKIPEPTRAAMYADAMEAGYQVGASLGAPDGTLIWWVLGEVSNHCWECPILAANSPYTRENLPSTPKSGMQPCRSNCKCHLTTRLAPGVPPPLTPEQKQGGRRFEDRVVNPPPVPPGLRLPTPEERAVMRDREIQLNFARRKAADAEAAGRKAEAKLWYQKRKELNAEAIAYAKERGIHDVPTFSVGEVINGKDIGQRDIDRLTHLRGIDGVTISRAQVAAIHEATAAAKRDVLAVLKDYPQASPVSREEWRRLLRENGAPASAFGGDLTRLATEAHVHHDGCDHEHGCVTLSGRSALDELRAVEAAVPVQSDATLPSPADIIAVNLMGESARETMENHAAVLATLANAGRRTGVNPYRVEAGPFDDGWQAFVVAAGTWIQGERGEVLRFLRALRSDAAPFAVAVWQPMG